MYSVAMLHALVKVQLSIVSRYVMFDQQAQQQRAEAEQAQQGQAPQPHQQQHPHDHSVSQPAFMPPAACEDVNRAYFSLSRHAQTVGASLLADHIAGMVRLELSEFKSLAG